MKERNTSSIQGILGNKSLNTKTKGQISVCSNKKVLKIQVITLKKKKIEEQPKHHEMTSKLSL